MFWVASTLSVVPSLDVATSVYLAADATPKVASVTQSCASRVHNALACYHSKVSRDATILNDFTVRIDRAECEVAMFVDNCDTFPSSGEYVRSMPDDAFTLSADGTTVVSASNRIRVSIGADSQVVRQAPFGINDAVSGRIQTMFDYTPQHDMRECHRPSTQNIKFEVDMGSFNGALANVAVHYSGEAYGDSPVSGTLSLTHAGNALYYGELMNTLTYPYEKLYTYSFVATLQGGETVNETIAANASCIRSDGRRLYVTFWNETEAYAWGSCVRLRSSRSPYECPTPDSTDQGREGDAYRAIAVRVRGQDGAGESVRAETTVTIHSIRFPDLHSDSTEYMYSSSKTLVDNEANVRGVVGYRTDDGSKMVVAQTPGAATVDRPADELLTGVTAADEAFVTNLDAERRPTTTDFTHAGSSERSQSPRVTTTHYRVDDTPRANVCKLYPNFAGESLGTAVDVPPDTEHVTREDKMLVGRRYCYSHLFALLQYGVPVLGREYDGRTVVVQKQRACSSIDFTPLPDSHLSRHAYQVFRVDSTIHRELALTQSGWPANASEDVKVRYVPTDSNFTFRIVAFGNDYVHSTTLFAFSPMGDHVTLHQYVDFYLGVDFTLDPSTGTLARYFAGTLSSMWRQRVGTAPCDSGAQEEDEILVRRCTGAIECAETLARGLDLEGEYAARVLDNMLSTYVWGTFAPTHGQYLLQTGSKTAPTLVSGVSIANSEFLGFYEAASRKLRLLNGFDVCCHPQTQVCSWPETLELLYYAEYDDYIPGGFCTNQWPLGSFDDESSTIVDIRTNTTLSVEPMYTIGFAPVVENAECVSLCGEACLDTSIVIDSVQHFVDSTTPTPLSCEFALGSRGLTRDEIRRMCTHCDLGSVCNEWSPLTDVALTDFCADLSQYDSWGTCQHQLPLRDVAAAVQASGCCNDGSCSSVVLTYAGDGVDANNVDLFLPAEYGTQTPKNVSVADLLDVLQRGYPHKVSQLSHHPFSLWRADALGGNVTDEDGCTVGVHVNVKTDDTCRQELEVGLELLSETHFCASRYTPSSRAERDALVSTVPCALPQLNASYCTDGVADLHGCGTNSTGTTRRSRSQRKLTGNSCHPRDTTLDLEGVGPVRIDRVAVGDRIRGLDGYEPVTGFMHAESAKSMEYYRFYTRSTSVAISDTHWLFVNGRETDPAKVVVGDVLHVLQIAGTPAAERIDRVERKVTLRGAFHVQVASGAYYADGILCSTYIAHVPLAAWKLFADTYAWARYKVGVPLTPEGQGPMSIFWPLHAYEALGLPTSTARTVWPVTMTATLFAEVFNTLWVRTPQLPATIMMLATSLTSMRGFTALTVSKGERGNWGGKVGSIPRTI